MECFQSVLWDSNDKGHGSHVGVPVSLTKEVNKIILLGDTNTAAIKSSTNTLLIK